MLTRWRGEWISMWFELLISKLWNINAILVNEDSRIDSHPFSLLIPK